MERGGNSMLLAVNAGSSSLKVAVFSASDLSKPQTSLSIEGIGTDNGSLVPEGIYEDTQTTQLVITDAAEAATLVREWLTKTLAIAPDAITAIGYRVVHGGVRYAEPTMVSEELTAYLNGITNLAPNHMPATLASIEAFTTAYPSALHVACFDTSFFHAIPEVAKALPISKVLQDELGIRRYGFHGLSYESLLDSFEAHEGYDAKHGRVIMAHLGSGASVCAVKNGQPVDMSMGFTPVSGIMMSTRSGDIEPGVITFLQQSQNYSTSDVADLVAYKGGLLGVSGLSADMHTLLEAQASNPNAALAVDLFCYKITKQIGAYAAVLGGVDSIIFSGGIGERSAEIRARICSSLGYLGSILDEKRNHNNERLISANGSSIGIHVIQAREDSTIIKQTVAILEKGA